MMVATDSSTQPYTGPPLPHEDISSLIITKRLFSRLSGQCYGLDGSLLSPLKACFSVIFNLICGLTSDWDQPIEDIQVTTLARDFLQVLKEKAHLLPSVSMYLMPEEYLVFEIKAFSDGSEWLSTFVMYLLSCLPSGERTPDTSASRNCGALCKTNHHSVPCNEACRCVMAVEAIDIGFLDLIDAFRRLK